VCGRASSIFSREELANIFQVEQVDAPELPARWNLAPSDLLYVVGTTNDGVRKLAAFKWGLLAPWETDQRRILVNVRAESLVSKRGFHEMARSRRAIVPLSGFYEWAPATATSQGRKRPFYFQPPNGRPLAVAAIWGSRHHAEGTEEKTVALVTTRANNLVGEIHPRMPAILPEESWGEWLKPGPLGQDRLETLLSPAPEETLERWEVGKAVNSPKAEGPDLVAPLRA